MLKKMLVWDLKIVAIVGRWSSAQVKFRKITSFMSNPNIFP